MIRALFTLFVVLALLGDARIFLFVMNRYVFGSHREEKNPWGPMLFTISPLLAGLTLLFWPLSSWIDRVLATRLVEKFTPQTVEEFPWSAIAAQIGSVWLIAAAAVGLLWIVDRAHALVVAEMPLAGVRTDEPRVIRLRKAHVPIALLRRLGAHNDLYDIEVTHHDLFIDDLPEAFDGYAISFLTDTHVVPFMRRPFYRECVAQAMSGRPDLVLFGGDFVTWRKHIPLAAELLTTGLAPRDGVYAVFGNHDYWAGTDEVRREFESRGVRFVVNRAVPLQRGGSRIWLAGIDEVYRGAPDVDAAFAEISHDDVCIGLSHHPDIIDDVLDRRIDLLLCGHTHGGQIRFPFFGAVVVPSVHEGAYASGFHRIRNVLLYVSRGIGAVPPLRILCRPEVATFTLRRGMRGNQKPEK